MSKRIYLGLGIMGIYVREDGGREIGERKGRWVRVFIPLIKIIIMIIRGIFAKGLRTVSKGNSNVANLAYRPLVLGLKLLQSFCIK